MSWEMCLSQTCAIKCLDVELLLRKTPTKGCCWPRNPHVSLYVTLPCLFICCLFLVLPWEHHSRAGRRRHSQVPTVLPGHQNTDLGAAKVEILLLGAATTCSTSAFICRPPARELSIQQSISRRAETPRCPQSTARPCPVLNPRLTERKRDFFFDASRSALSPDH